MSDKYEFSMMPGGILTKTQARIAGKELVRIEKRYGAVKPARLVEDSRPDKAPLHDYFTWDDGVAAEKCRKDEARSIIRSVRIVLVSKPAEDQPIMRAYVHVEAHSKEDRFDGPAYIALTRAVHSEPYRLQLIETAKAELAGWQRRYRDLLNFSGAEAALETLELGLTSQAKKG